MNHAAEHHLGELSEPCVVCGKSLVGLEKSYMEEVMGEMIAMCSEVCRAEFLKDPEKYTMQNGEEEED